MNAGCPKIRLERGQLVVGGGKKEQVVRPIVKPFIKWAGGKQWLSPVVPLLKPKDFAGGFFEPFLGGGAFYFALEPARATLSDVNRELILTYKTLSKHLEEVANLLRTYPYERDFFEQMRENNPVRPIEVAARFIYLNRTCWNGLYRVNQLGHFNTPFGRLKNPTICDIERLTSASKMLSRARFLCADFEEAVRDAGKGDFVYFDPPYISKHHNNSFLKYNAPLFSWQDQIRLANVSQKLSASGVYVLLSNAAHRTVIDLYKGFRKYTIERRSLIGSSAESRGWSSEVLISNYEIFA